MTLLLGVSLPAVQLAVSFRSAGAAGTGRLRRQIRCGRDAARGLIRLAQLVARALAVDGAFAVGEKSLPRHALRIGDPLLVRFMIAAGGVLGFDDWALGACQPIVNLGKFSLVLGLDTEMGNAGGASGGTVADLNRARMTATADAFKTGESDEAPARARQG